MATSHRTEDSRDAPSSTPSQPYSEPSYAKPPSTASQLPWWRDNIDKYNTGAANTLISKYAGVPESEQSAHIHAIRDKAWQIRSYPITGLGCFLTPYFAHSTAHNAVVEKVRAGGRLIDIGCFMGVDMRQLVFEGCPSDKMLGVDIVKQWHLGYELYRDQDHFKGDFIEADVLKLSPDSAEFPSLRDWKGDTDVIGLCAVLHQWDWETQFAAVKQLVAFSKVGTMVVGYQIGNEEGGERDQQMGPQTVKVFRQSPKTMIKLWADVGEATGTKWETEARLRHWEDIGWDAADMFWMSKGDMPLDFVARRVE